jgi:hypothetical protein
LDLPAGAAQMPRFFFHVHKEGQSLGAIEEDLHDPSIALSTARGVARELLATLEQGWISAFIEVTDERGSLLGIIPMSDFLLQ